MICRRSRVVCKRTFQAAKSGLFIPAYCGLFTPALTSAIKRTGCLSGTPNASSACAISFTSAGEAESRCAPNGVPAPSTTTSHFVPLPRLVLPTLSPPFWPVQNCHRQNTHPIAVCLHHPVQSVTHATDSRTRLVLPSLASVANTLMNYHILLAAPTTVHPSMQSTKCRRNTFDHRPAVVHLACVQVAQVCGREFSPTVYRLHLSNPYGQFTGFETDSRKHHRFRATI